ncbi:MAG TPA: S9 family peptidase [Vicinamibacterales bacterium]|nr:S9 family peptidase [Vicinamibacterales bacterium]
MRHRHLPLVVLALLALAAGAGARAQMPSSPSIDDLLNLKRVATPALSPDAKWVAYTVRETNWDDNAYETEIWVAPSDSGEPHQLTNAAKSSSQPAWSPDSRTLGFISDRDGKRQIYRIDMAGGEAEKLTSAEEGVTSFAWAPDGKSIAFTALDPQTDAMKTRDKQWGEVKIEDEDQRYTHLYVLDPATKKTRALTSGAFVVGSFDWSPDGSRIAFDHRVSSDAGEGGSADISIVDVASGTRTPLITQPGPDSNPRWSPDGSRIAFVTAMAKTFYFYENSVIAVTTPGTAGVTSLTDAFDEDPSLVDWTTGGIVFSAAQRTAAALFTLDPASRAIRKYQAGEAWIGTQFSVSADGSHVAFVGAGPKEFADVYAGEVAAIASARRISDTRAQVASWPAHTREVVRWKSQDGAEIEGVLHKPAGFETGRRYPLLVVIHGGPTGISRPLPYSNYVGTYPIDGFLARGALVLEPNYRGSAGYGAKFRALNVRNLGIGDAWDVLSGVDSLVAQGLVDRDRVGSMGWSQGGYISAFLTTRHADRFRAISVGAGISDWMTYYVNTDIHPFTRQYLKATPWDDPKIYADTSPMTYIKQAKTPTLIQHGDQDARVPIPNAFQLYQGLRDVNVPVRLSIFKGFGHGINKPKANRALMEQNWEFFGKYIWGEGTATQR